ncbi:pyridoxamine 5'-phosphate oxidase family protein [Gilliamella sp. B2776]|uniref:pyridoxamine 5'-phosphate oxidase family protein n=1 Tax=unclassified Gilliamella TaxID=2685620 RepID=UPI00226991F1|nr:MULTISPECIES: pyridoxamine 5'-phosphate oxidase family protein [unclassified Gilliamella]MCX8650489.1 pyridoxamine 5'-phosphate oxidase family protein [Gilliamella sp. B2779]MCX8654465.1 pyridoxamine 5'-phosphate oxidase family protein [Gilliamella sp. B2737]MCX8656794.1 pyridoxamine 5'-phosphate oxidase family protein [Gilliamella sp. B2894]MCX8665462.1 pyridoxamine 5'-phosphate oxidase family protein [Gilliamella sp. B2887]MCX8692337.1 pyridoxamine 5'-phosphate oxidase family protein [Gil
MLIDPKILKFIKINHILTLSVITPDNSPWACNVFYVLDEVPFNLYFLTELKTEHAKAMLMHPNVAGTITVEPKTIAQIQGIQFLAQAKQLQGEQAKDAYRQYYRAFPFARMMKAPIWSLQLQQIKMTNNLLGFAHKTHWQRK